MVGVLVAVVMVVGGGDHASQHEPLKINSMIKKTTHLVGIVYVLRRKVKEHGGINGVFRNDLSSTSRVEIPVVFAHSSALSK